MRVQALFCGIALALLANSYLLAQEKKPAEKASGDKTDSDKKPAPAKPSWSPYSSIQQFKIIAAIDEDLDGTVTAKEIDSAVERIQKLDANGDGKLTSAEFLKEGKVPGTVLTWGVVKGLDADKDGELSADEIKGAVEVLKKLDANKNNKLESFEYAMRSPMGMGVSSDTGAGGPGGPGGGGGGRQMPSPEEFMKSNDKNSDGKVEKSELTGPAANFFDRMDENKDGGITLEEVKASRERMRQHTGGGGGPGGGRGGGCRGGACGPGGAPPAGATGEGEKKSEAPKTDAPK
jgi:hypothetical protein